MKILSSKKNISRLASVILGIVLWFIVIYTEDANINVKLKGLDVQVAGEHQLFENHLVITNKNDLKRASVSVRGKRNDIIKAMGDVTATIDVSGIVAPGTHNVTVSYGINTSAVYVADNNTPTIEVKVEKTQTRELDAEVIQIGKREDDLIVESQPSEAKVVVEGKASDIEKIEYAAVYVNTEELTSDSEGEYNVVLLDSDHEEVEFENKIGIDKEKIVVKNLLHKKVNVPVKIEGTDIDTDKYVIDVKNKSREKIFIGLDDGVEYQEAIYTINVEAITEEAVSYKACWKEKEGVYIPEKSKEIDVEVSIFPKVKKTISIPIEVRGVEGQYVLSNEELILNVSGAEKDINEENIKATVELGEYKSGTHTVKVNVEIKKETIFAKTDNHYVSIAIS